MKRLMKSKLDFMGYKKGELLLVAINNKAVVITDKDYKKLPVLYDNLSKYCDEVDNTFNARVKKEFQTKKRKYKNGDTFLCDTDSGYINVHGEMFDVDSFNKYFESFNTDINI